MSRNHSSTMTAEITTAKEAFEHLKNNYRKLGSPVALSGPLKLYKFYNGLLTIKQIKQYLSSVDTYVLYSQKPKSQKQYNLYWVRSHRHTLEADLVSLYSSLSSSNQGIK